MQPEARRTTPPRRGDLDMDGLLAGFQGFFREHSEHWIERFQYKEAGPQLCCRRSCTALSTAAAGSSASTLWAAGARTC